MAIKQITNIVKEIVSNTSFDTLITGNIDNGLGNHILSMDNTFTLNEGTEIIIDGKKYAVTSFVFNISVTVKPVGHTTTIIATTFNIPAPLFFYGSIKSTEREVLATMRSTPNSYPIFYLLEPIKEKFISDITSSIERQSKISIFLLDIYDKTKDINEDLLVNILEPLSNLETKFYEAIDNSKCTEELKDDIERTNLARFAIIGPNGEEKRVFNEYLGGIRIDLTLPIKRKNCNC